MPAGAHRRTHPTREVCAAAVAAIAVLVGGCTSASSDTTAPVGTDPGAVSQTSDPGEPETLADLLGPAFDPSDPQAAQAYYLDQERSIQEAIRACMAEAGFEYVPVEWPAGEIPADASAEEEVVRTRGFGITTWFGTGTGFVDPGMEQWDDPNRAIQASLGADQLQAYRRARYGVPDEVPPSTDVDPATGDQVDVVTGFGSGCEGRAYEAAYGDQERIFEELEPAFAELDARIESDPRIDDLRRAWSECMASAGFDHRDRRAMLEEGVAGLQRRMEEIVGTDAFESWTPEQVERFLAEEAGPDVASRIEDLQSEEIALAVADLGCSRDHEEAYARVSAEYEDEFIDAHRELLERLAPND